MRRRIWPERRIGMAAYDKAHELARELKESDEYKEYQKAKQAILQSDTALSILKEYRKKQLEYEMSLLAGTEPDPKKKEELDKISEIVNMHGAVKRFLEAEQRVLVMMTDVQRILTGALDLLEYA
jgi:cell fate (sporulation/competence/biofilm development) regulator YlbF (YheA/YmcA/DUF963 family)